MNGQMRPRYVSLNAGCLVVLLTRELQNAVVTTKDMQRILLAGLELWRNHRREGLPPSTEGDAPLTSRSRRHLIGKRQGPYCGEPRRRDLETLQLQVRTLVCRWDQYATTLNL